MGILPDLAHSGSHTDSRQDLLPSVPCCVVSEIRKSINFLEWSFQTANLEKFIRMLCLPGQKVGAKHEDTLEFRIHKTIGTRFFFDLHLFLTEKVFKNWTLTRFFSRFELRSWSFSLLEVDVFSRFLSPLDGCWFLSLAASAWSSLSCWERIGGGFWRITIMSTRFFRLDMSREVSLCLFLESLSQPDSSKNFVSFLRPMAAAICSAVSPFWNTNCMLVNLIRSSAIKHQNLMSGCAKVALVRT